MSDGDDLIDAEGMTGPPRTTRQKRVEGRLSMRMFWDAVDPDPAIEARQTRSSDIIRQRPENAE